MVILNIPEQPPRKTRAAVAPQRGLSSPSTHFASQQTGCCSNNVAVAARAYARLGWAVLPLHSISNGVCTCKAGVRCPSPGKHPLLSGGVHGATRDLNEVARLWREHQNANIGIATGEASGLIVIDVDPRNGGHETAKRLAAELGHLPQTVYSDTGGKGSHRLFLYPETSFATSHLRADLSGLDVQSDGAYIVAPPSRHISGQLYSWRNKCDPSSQPLAALPGNWLDRLRRPKTLPSPASTPASAMVCEGGRNIHLTSRAGALRKAGLSAEALLAALKVENSERCFPPLDEEEVARIAASVGRYSAGTPSNGDEAEGMMQAVLDEH